MCATNPARRFVVSQHGFVYFNPNSSVFSEAVYTGSLWRPVRVQTALWPSGDGGHCWGFPPVLYHHDAVPEEGNFKGERVSHGFSPWSDACFGGRLL